MKCPKCDFNGNPNLEETGPHTKATCPKCKAYIKMVSKDELEDIINASIKNVDDEEPIDQNEGELTLVIHTTAPREYMPTVLQQVKVALGRGYITGDGLVNKPFDERLYHYDFYYK